MAKKSINDESFVLISYSVSAVRKNTLSGKGCTGYFADSFSVPCGTPHCEIDALIEAKAAKKLPFKEFSNHRFEWSVVKK